jgi:tetratricopeptide (TPR) repeat protein
MGRSRLLAGIAAITLALALIWAGWLLAGSLLVKSGLAGAKRRIAAGQYRLARDKLAALSAWWPRHGEVEYLLGTCESRLGRPRAALAAWARVPGGSPRSNAAALASGRVLVHSLGRLHDAELMYRRAMRSSGKKTLEARWALAELLLWEGRLDDLRGLLKEIWRVGEPLDRTTALRELWRLDSVIVSAEDVQPVLDKAALFASDDSHVQLVRAFLAMQYGRYDVARGFLEQSAREERDPALAQLLRRARLQWALATSDPQEARRALAAGAHDGLSTLELCSLGAWFAARRGDAAAEAAALEEVVALAPGNTQALDRLATLALQSRQPTRAAAFRRCQTERIADQERFRRLLLLDETPIPKHELHERARLAERLGRWFEARGWLNEALARDPIDDLARASLDRLAADPRATASESPGAFAPETSLLDLVREPVARAAAAPPTAARSLDASPPPEAAAIAFRDDAQSSNLAFIYDNGESHEHQIPETIGGGVAVLDYDGDGWLDVFLVQGGTFPPSDRRFWILDFGLGIPGIGLGLDALPLNLIQSKIQNLKSRIDGDRLFRNRGDGTFEDATVASSIGRIDRGYGMGVTAGDYNNDGYPDLFLTRYGSYTLLQNQGDGTFANVTARAGLGGARDWPTSAAFADLDGDGDLDLYVCHYLVWDAWHPIVCPDPRSPDGYASCLPLRFPARPDHLFRNDGGHFVDVTVPSGIVDRNGRGLGVLAADLDGDHRVDVFVANDMTANFLFRNLGNLKFDEIAHQAGVACNAAGGYQAGMGVACGDLDHDGRPDLAVTNFFGESTTLFHNLGHGMFCDSTAASGLKAPSRFLLGFGVTFLDADNDGCLDLATANGHIHNLGRSVPHAMPAQLLAGDGQGHLMDISRGGGAVWSEPRIGRGLAAADLDNDGRVDLLLVAQNSPVTFFHNRTEPSGHFVTIRLEGSTSNRDAIGATVHIAAGACRQTAWRFGGGSYVSAPDPRLHFGIRSDRLVDVIEVRWPSGRRDHFRDLRTDVSYSIREEEPKPVQQAGFAASPR